MSALQASLGGMGSGSPKAHSKGCRQFFPTISALRHFSSALCALLAFLHSVSLQAATQTIELRAGWNLISLQVGESPIPAASFRTSLANPAALTEVWGYDASGDPTRPGTWRTYQPALEPGFPSDLSSLSPGRGYWVNVSARTTLSLGDANTPVWSGGHTLAPGWNLVGFAGLATDSTEQQDLASVFGPAFDRVPQVWSFDAAAQRFVGYDTTAIPALRTLATVTPGSAYWVYALEATSLTPAPFLALPQDADESPLQPEEFFSAAKAGSGAPVVSNPAAYLDSTGQPLSVRYRGPEDVSFDLNNNGIIDDPFTQDTLVFQPGIDAQVISIGNEAAGLFPWSITKVGSIPWLRFDTASTDAPAAFADLPASASGTVSAERDSVVFRVDRTGLLPGRYTGATVTVQAGTLTRTLRLILVVPNSGGDWKGAASVKRVNGKPIALGKVDLALSAFMASDALTETRFRAILNRDRSLLFPKDIFMNGVFYAGNQFSLTTSFLMPAGDRNSPPYDTFSAEPANPAGDRDTNNNGTLDVANPFGVAITREVTLLGTRQTPDLLSGSYVEAIGGLLPSGQLVFMEGDFSLTRESSEPTKRSVFNAADTETLRLGGSSGTGFIERTISVADAVSIQGVTATLNTAFSRPAALVITLTSPAGTVATLHRNGATLPSLASFALATFNGENGSGPWKLRITWDRATTPERGFFYDWSLNLEGLATYVVTGRVVGPDGLGLPGAQLILSGSNLIAQATAASGLPTVPATGTFSFSDLTENNYALNVSLPGYVTATRSFLLTDEAVPLGDIALSPLTLPNGTAILTAAPAFGAAPLRTAFLLQVPLSELDTVVGANPVATWDFGDGSAPVSDTASLADDITVTTARFTYTRPGAYSARVTLTGAIGSITRTVLIQAQRLAPDPAGPAYQLSNIAFVGSIASPSFAQATNAPSAILTTPPSTVTVALPGGGTIPGVASATVWQESKRDVAAFDVDRFPFRATVPFAPNAEDTDAPPANGVYDAYVPDVVGDQPIPERWRLEVTLGGAVFGATPSAVGDFRLQTGAVQP